MPSLEQMDMGPMIPIAFSSDDLFEDLLLPAPSLDMSALAFLSDAAYPTLNALEPAADTSDSHQANTLNVLLPSIVTPAPAAAPLAQVLPPPPAPQAAPTRFSAESATMMSDEDSEMDEDEEGSGNNTKTSSGGQPKRRRRVRNAKQQELNRLAQQRYRLRKKQKQVDLQLTVEQLASQLEQLKAKDVQIDALRSSEAQLKQQLRAQQAMLAQAQQELAEQRALVAKQAKELETLKATKQAQPQVATEELIKQHVAQVLLETLAELGISGAQLEDVSQNLIRTVSCLYNNQLVGLRAPGVAGNPITVSCC